MLNALATLASYADTPIQLQNSFSGQRSRSRKGSGCQRPKNHKAEAKAKRRAKRKEQNKFWKENLIDGAVTIFR